MALTLSGRPKSAKGQLGLKLASTSTQDGVRKAKNTSIATRAKALLPAFLDIYVTYAYYFNQIGFVSLAESHKLAYYSGR